MTASGSRVANPTSLLKFAIIAPTAPYATLSVSDSSSLLQDRDTSEVPVATVARIGGVTGDLTLETGTLPVGVTASFASSTLVPSASTSTLSLSALTAPVPGSYSLRFSVAGTGIATNFVSFGSERFVQARFAAAELNELRRKKAFDRARRGPDAEECAHPHEIVRGVAKLKLYSHSHSRACAVCVSRPRSSLNRGRDPAIDQPTPILGEHRRHLFRVSVIQPHETAASRLQSSCSISWRWRRIVNSTSSNARSRRRADWTATPIRAFSMWKRGNSVVSMKIDQRMNRAHRMLGRSPVFDRDVDEQRPLWRIGSTYRHTPTAVWSACSESRASTAKSAHSFKSLFGRHPLIADGRTLARALLQPRQ